MLLVPRDQYRGAVLPLCDGKAATPSSRWGEERGSHYNTSLTKIFPFSTSQQEIVGKLKRAT
eukprot:scaffold150394_cov40-Cyclotella_meneghiniana.AAC.3